VVSGGVGLDPLYPDSAVGMTLPGAGCTALDDYIGCQWGTRVSSADLTSKELWQKELRQRADEGGRVMTSANGLATYLNDHLAGAVAGSELANKISIEYADTPSGLFLAELARDIVQDKATLEELMERLGIQRSPLKQAASWIGEKLSRVKLSETMTGDRDLKRLLEFETLSLGIEGKLSMWRALISVSHSHVELAATDLAMLVKRAESQRSNLEDHRLQIANAALID
jgi:hypothetical protein